MSCGSEESRPTSERDPGLDGYVPLVDAVGVGIDPLPWMGVAALTPFFAALSAELGRRVGASITALGWRIWVRWTSGKKKADLLIDTGGGETVLEVDEQLTDEAKYALLDLDFTAEGARGRRLRWNGELGAWQPVDHGRR